jgi:hypothetical protein
MDMMPRDARQRTKSIDARTKRGFVLGTVLMYSDTMFRVSQHTFRHKELTKALCKLGRESFPNFPFTSIMVNKDGCPLHVDRNNCGPSMICSLGKHTGGELWQWPGDVLDIHNEFKLSDGLLPHATLPFEGERYSLVYYCVKELRAPPCEEDVKLLHDLGFWSMEARPVKAGRARLDLLKLAAAKLNDYLRETSNASNDAPDGSVPVSLPSLSPEAASSNGERNP